MRRGIGQWFDNLELLDDGAGPAVRDDKRQRIWMFGTNVDEENVHSINLGDELRQGVQSRFDFAPVVICGPIAREFLHRSELYALRSVRHKLARWPLRCLYMLAQLGKFRFRNVDVEGTDCVGVFLGNGS